MGWSDPLLLLTSNGLPPESKLWTSNSRACHPVVLGQEADCSFSYPTSRMCKQLICSVHLSLWHNSWAEEFLEKECIRTERRTLQRRCLCWMWSFQASKFMVKTLRQPKKVFFLFFSPISGTRYFPLSPISCFIYRAGSLSWMRRLRASARRPPWVWRTRLKDGSRWGSHEN